jgi:hypothetical protein
MIISVYSKITETWLICDTNGINCTVLYYIVIQIIRKEKLVWESKLPPSKS